MKRKEDPTRVKIRIATTQSTTKYIKMFIEAIEQYEKECNVEWWTYKWLCANEEFKWMMNQYTLEELYKI